ncbi:type III-B CRISPR module RAMP protein Cmr1 [Candidatus Halobeggiatoa sp. HSG11]|nr:type III-B CRISPR module RAMP protein Cmr1 [Candidatus Halobeggiatoa sp. HSG11]
MKTLKATYQIVTPMFIGDAEQKATSIRPPSIKGALRFWWRALNWGGFFGTNVEDSLKELHEEECRLFGSSEIDGKGGQGVFLLQVISNVTPLQPENLINQYPLQNQNGYIYLLGQGLYTRQQGQVIYQRSALPAEKTFTIKLCFRKDIDESIVKTLLLFGLMGSLGSRSRRGFGSVSIKSLTGYDKYKIPENTEEYKEILIKLCKNLPCDLPPFTAFSEKSRIDISMIKGKKEKVQNILNDIGNEMNTYRSFKSKKIEFQDDHDLAYDVSKGIRVSEHPRRVIFGLPHNYYLSSGKKVDVKPIGKERGRRASPLFIHLHQFPDNSYAAIQFLLPSSFLPSSDRIEIKSGHNANQIPHNVDWKVIHKFLDRFSTRTNII